MSKERENWVIIKEMEHDGKTLNVILVDSLGEIQEYDDENQAIHMAAFMEANSDSGHKYVVKKV